MKGKRYVVLRTAIIWAISFYILFSVVSWFSTGRSIPMFFYFVFPALGTLAGMTFWWMNEGRFQDFLLDKKIKAGLRR